MSETVAVKRYTVAAHIRGTPGSKGEGTANYVRKKPKKKKGAKKQKKKT